MIRLVDSIPGAILHIDKALDNASKKVEYFLDHLQPDTELTALMSNDVYLTQRSVEEMENLYFRTLQKQPIILSPLSNNEHGTRFIGQIPYKQTGYEFEDIDFEFLKYYSPYFGIHYRMPWVSFICPFIPVAVWKKLGRLDPLLDRSHNDIDFCMRAALHGIATFVNTNAFALHFGSKTMGKGYDNSKEMAHFQSKFSPFELLQATM
jgi:GT2 family glycosyltransferase